MVRINGLACPAAAVSTSRSLRVVRTFLSNVLSISSRHPESGTSTRRSKAKMTPRFTSRTGWQTIGDLKNPTTPKSIAARAPNKVAIASIALNLGPLDYTFAVRTQRTRETHLCGLHNAAVSAVVPRRRAVVSTVVPRRRNRDRDRCGLLRRRHVGRRRRRVEVLRELPPRRERVGRKKSS